MFDIPQLPPPISVSRVPKRRAQTTREVLDAAATKIAVGSILLDYWSDGVRHDLALSVAGLLAKHGWNEDEVVQFIEAVCAVTNDDEVCDRIIDVRTTYDNHRNGQPVKGWTGLLDCIGSVAAGHIDKFVGGGSSNGDLRPLKAANSNCQWSKSNFSSDHDAAMTFAAQCEGNLRFSTGTDQWYQREVQVFEPVAPAMAQGIVGDFAAMAHHQLGDDAGKIKSRAKINAILELSRAPLAIDQDVIDADRDLVGLTDGRILNLKTGNVVPSDEDVFVTKELGAVYDPAAQCPRWLQFLNTIFAGNQDMIDFVQRAVGYCLSGEVTKQCLFIMIGSGANGKSTFINAVRHMLGNYAGATPMQTLTVMPFSNGQTNDLAAMEGKRFISASDGEAGQRLAEAKIKNMTGGNPINCRAMYKEYRDVHPQFKLWVATNDLPNVSGSDDAIWRRIRVIDFPVTIPESERDPNLASDLAAEASGILNWTLDGYGAWKADGLKPPAEVTNATGSYRQDNDLVGQFIDERCVQNSTAKSTNKVLHEGYSRWCDENGHMPMAVNLFAKELKRKKFTSYKGRTANGWVGVDLKPAYRTTDGDQSMLGATDAILNHAAAARKI